MLFTIVQNGKFKGLLYMGEKIPAGMMETASVAPVLELLGPMGQDRGGQITDALESAVTFLHSDNPSTRAILKELGYELYRCTEMTAPGEAQ